MHVVINFKIAPSKYIFWNPKIYYKIYIFYNGVQVLNDGVENAKPLTYLQIRLRNKGYRVFKQLREQERKKDEAEGLCRSNVPAIPCDSHILQVFLFPQLSFSFPFSFCCLLLEYLNTVSVQSEWNRF